MEMEETARCYLSMLLPVLSLHLLVESNRGDMMLVPSE